MNRAAVVEELAPPAPPCFSRSQWIEWLRAAAAAQKPPRPGPLVFEAGQAVRFNTSLNFCRECGYSPHERRAMGRQCNPTYLRELERVEA